MIFQSFRSVSNLQDISKLTEKAVFSQTHEHMVVNEIYPDLQLSYRQHHSTETALLKIMSNALLKMTLMVLLDLSAAFDIVDHNILLERLRRDVGVRGKVLDWFSSYLLNQSQQVSIDGSLSRQFPLDCDAPQGSCLGPLLFVIYTSPLFKVIEHHLLQVHCFTDKAQLYLSFRADEDKAQDVALRAMEECIRDIQNWLIDGRMVLSTE